jgi:hypothetical protein
MTVGPHEHEQIAQSTTRRDELAALQVRIAPGWLRVPLHRQRRGNTLPACTYDPSIGVTSASVRQLRRSWCARIQGRGQGGDFGG